MPFISFYHIDVKPVLKNRKAIKQFIPILFSTHCFSLQSLTIVFCSDDYLLELNQQFLQHDYYTDILTFNLSSSKDIEGEIYISIDRVLENSLTQSIAFQEELKRVVFHGVLHLCGFLDKTAIQKKKMTFAENSALLQFSQFHVKQ